jgi:Tfp pilus assembly protein PilN
MTSQPDQQTAETVTVTRVEWAPVPRVNLLPPEILDARGFRKVQGRLVTAVVATLVVVAAATIWGQTRVNSAQDALDAASAQTVVLHRQEARYAEVPRLTSAVAAAKAARAAALSQDMLWYRLLNDIALTTPSNVWLTTMNVNLGSGTSPTGDSRASASPSSSGSDPLVPAGIGKVTVTGTASSYPDVAAWLEAIVRVHGLDASTLQTATREVSSGSGGTGAQVQFTSAIVIAPTALSHRYDQKAG